jgi:hypothetical protein
LNNCYEHEYEYNDDDGEYHHYDVSIS